MAGNPDTSDRTICTIRTISPDTLATPGGHYSHATVANGMVFISGQLPITPDGRKLADAPFAEQAMQVLANVEAALVAAGSSIGALVQVRVYVDSIDNWPVFNAIYAAWAGAARPARAVVPTGPLHFGLKVEVEAVALASRAQLTRSRVLGKAGKSPLQKQTECQAPRR